MDNSKNRRIKRAIESYLKRLGKKFKIEKSILFGSRARGDYLDNSDVDLIVVSKDFLGINFRKRMAEAIEDWNQDLDLEVICYTPKEFEKKKKQIGIVKQAVKEGIEI